MPPADNRVDARRLTSEELGLIQLWVEQGAQGEVRAAGAEMNWQPLPSGVNPIYAVAATDDAQFVACGRANQVFIYHLPTGQTIDRLTDPALLSAGLYQQPGVAHRDLVQSLAFSPDGYTLASGGYRVVKLWQRPRDVELLDLATSDTGATTFALSADGTWLATAHGDHQIRLWQMPVGTPGPVLAGHASTVTGLRFNADGTRLASSSHDGTLRVWNPAEGKLLYRIHAPGPLNDVSWNADGTQLISAGADHQVRTWSLSSARHEGLLVADAPLTAIATSSQGQLAWSTNQGKLFLQNVSDGDSLRQLNGQFSSAAELAFASDGSQLVARDATGSVTVFGIASAQPVAEFASVGALTSALPWGNETMLLGDAQGLLVVWNVRQQRSRVEPVGESAASLLAISADGNLLASDTTIDGQAVVLVREFATRDILARLVGHSSALLDICFNADGGRLLSTSTDGSVVLWNVSSGSPLLELTDLASAPTHAVFLAEEQLATAHLNGEIHVWQASDAATVRSFDQLADQQIILLRASSSGDVLAAVTRQGAFRVWPANANEPLVAVDATYHVEHAALDAGLERVALACSDRQLRLVARDGAIVEVPELASTSIHSMTFTPDGARLVVGSLDRRIAVVDVLSGKVIERHQSSGDLTALALAPQTGELLLATTDRRLHSQSLRASHLAVDAGSPIVALIPTADPQRVIVGTQEGQLLSVDPAARSVTPWAKLESSVQKLALSPDAALLAVATEDSAIVLLRTVDQQPALSAPLAGLDHAATALSFSPDGRFVVGAAGEGDVLAWRVSDGQLVERQPTSGPLVGLRAGDSGVLVATPAGIRAWNPAAEQVLSGHAAPVTSLALWPDGTHIVSGSEDGIARQWELGSGKEMRRFDHGGPITAVAVRPDGQRLATAGANHTVRLWNGADAAQVAEIKGDYTAAKQLARREKAEARIRADLDAAVQSVADIEKDLLAKQEAAKTTAETLVAAEKVAADTTAVAQKAEREKGEAIELAQAATQTAKTATEAKTAADALAAQTAEIASLAADAANLTQSTLAAFEQALAAARESSEKLAVALQKSPEDQELVAAKQRADQAIASTEQSLAGHQPLVAAAQQLAAARMATATKAATQQAAATEAATQAMRLWPKQPKSRPPPKRSPPMPPRPRKRRPISIRPPKKLLAPPKMR